MSASGGAESDRSIPTNADIEALLRAPHHSPSVSQRAPLRVIVSTDDLDVLLTRGIQYQRENLRECEVECEEAEALFARAVQARADFSDFLNSECGTRIEISLYPSERNWCWDVKQAFESDENEEKNDDDSFDSGEYSEENDEH